MNCDCRELPFQAGDVLVPIGDRLAAAAASATINERHGAVHAATVMRRNAARMVELIEQGEDWKARQVKDGTLGFLRSAPLADYLLAWASAL